MLLNLNILQCIYIYIYIFVSPCVGGSIVLPRTLYCIKYQLAGVYISAKPHRLICIHSHHKLHSGDTNYIKHAQIRYVYAIKHSPSGYAPSGLETGSGNQLDILAVVKVLLNMLHCEMLYSVYVPIGHALSNTYIYILSLLRVR